MTLYIARNDVLNEVNISNISERLLYNKYKTTMHIISHIYKFN